jgi:hypothetical protein
MAERCVAELARGGGSDLADLDPHGEGRMAGSISSATAAQLSVTKLSQHSVRVLGLGGRDGRSERSRTEYCNVRHDDSPW